MPPEPATVDRDAARSLPPTVIAEVRRVLDCAARRLLAERTDEAGAEAGPGALQPPEEGAAAA